MVKSMLQQNGYFLKIVLTKPFRKKIHLMGEISCTSRKILSKVKF